MWTTQYQALKEDFTPYFNEQNLPRFSAHFLQSLKTSEIYDFEVKALQGIATMIQDSICLCGDQSYMPLRVDGLWIVSRYKSKEYKMLPKLDLKPQKFHPI